MTPFLLLYYALLVVWLPLLWPAWRLRGWARVWLLIVAGCGLASALYEASLWAGTMPSIRLDIPLISIALGFLYGSAAAVLFGAGWRKAAAALGLALAAVAGVMAYEWILISRESQRLSEVFRERDSLLFAAKFRDRETFERTFGQFTPTLDNHPIGHWEAPDDWQYSRLIINREGRAWLFYRCTEDAECPLDSGEAGLARIGEESGGGWQVTVKRRVIAPTTLTITEQGPDRLSVDTGKRSLVFTATPPPIDPAPAPASLTYLGAYAGMLCNSRGSHADIRQLWLWREGERLYGVGIMTNRVAGRRAAYVSAFAMGEGIRDGDEWAFSWRHSEQDWRASVRLEPSAAHLNIEHAGEAPKAMARRIAMVNRIALVRAPLFRDEAVELAPLTSKADWEHWFEIVLTGHHTTGQVPACDEDQNPLVAPHPDTP